MDQASDGLVEVSTETGRWVIPGARQGTDHDCTSRGQPIQALSQLSPKAPTHSVPYDTAAYRLAHDQADNRAIGRQPWPDMHHQMATTCAGTGTDDCREVSRTP